MFTPSTVSLEEWWVSRRSSPLDSIPTSPLGNKVNPLGPTSPMGAKIRSQGEIKIRPLYYVHRCMQKETKDSPVSIEIDSWHQPVVGVVDGLANLLQSGQVADPRKKFGQSLAHWNVGTGGVAFVYTLCVGLFGSNRYLWFHEETMQ
jgi:hypothetical protein